VNGSYLDAVFVQTFIFKGKVFSEMPAFVVSSEEKEGVWECDFE
jgi:hypothetical protein